MTTSLDDRVRHEIGRYLRRETTLKRFETWLIESTWNRVDPSDTALMHLVGEVELTLAEYSSGHWTEDEVRAHLRDAASHELVTQAHGKAAP